MALFLMIILVAMILSLSLFLLFTQRYVNPYTLGIIFGKKGSGKSTTLTKLAIRHLMKNWTVYSTEPIYGTYLIKPSDIGLVNLVDYNYIPFDPEDYKGINKLFQIVKNYFFPRKPKILLLIDEVGLVWHCRDFKSFKTEVRKFFKLQRHYHVKCVMFSQCFDVDKTLRDLTDYMYLVRNVGRVFVFGKRIHKYFTIKTCNNDENEGNSTLVENFEFDKFFIPGARMLTFIPHWSKYFDSFVTEDDLPMHRCKLVR